jgi:hypothetical protein
VLFFFLQIPGGWMISLVIKIFEPGLQGQIEKGSGVYIHHKGTRKSKIISKKEVKRFMRSTFLSIIIVIAFIPMLLSGSAKVVYIPDDITVEENCLKASTIRDLSKEAEIYWCAPIKLVDDFFYLLDYDKYRVVKLSLQGKVVGQFGKKGEGPGEFLGISGISTFKKNIAVTGRYKVVICDKDLKFIREIKLTQMFHDLILGTNNRIYFYNNPSYSNYYFSVYSEDFKYLKKFGIKNPDAKEETIPDQKFTVSWDVVRTTCYVPEENGIWVSFKDRYDLRYYKDEKAIVDIKPKKQIFATSEDKFSGQKIMRYLDYSLLIAKHANKLYYCYKLGDNLFCDVFNLAENYRLIRRLKFPYRYKKLILSNGSIFYGLRGDAKGENVLLDKVQIDQKGGK